MAEESERHVILVRLEEEEETTQRRECGGIVEEEELERLLDERVLRERGGEASP